MARRSGRPQQRRKSVRAAVVPPSAEGERGYVGSPPPTRIRDIGMGGVGAEVEHGPLAEKLLSASLRGFAINVQVEPQEPPIWVKVRSVWVESTEGGVRGGFEFLEVDEEAQSRVVAYLKQDLQRRVVEACAESASDKDLEQRLADLLKERGATT